MFSDDEIITGVCFCVYVFVGVYVSMCMWRVLLLHAILTAMIAKYQRQASVKDTVSTPTAAISFGRQFSQQQSTQAPQPDDEEVWSAGIFKNCCQFKFNFSL